MLAMVHSNKAYGRAGALKHLPLNREGVFRDTVTQENSINTTDLPVWSAGVGKFGAGANDFDAANRRLEYTSPNNFTQFSFGFWIRRNAATKNQNMDTVVLYDAALAGHNYVQIARILNSGTQDSQLQTEWRASNVRQFRGESTGITWAAHQWYYLLFQRVGDSWKLYRDGVEVCSSTRSGTVSTMTGKMGVGNNIHPSVIATYFFNGQIENLIFTERILPTTPPVRPLR
jgi:hypothetical protein